VEAAQREQRFGSPFFWQRGWTDKHSVRVRARLGGTHNYLMKGKLIGGLVAGPA